MPPFSRVLLVAVLAVTLSGCGTVYLAQAAAGQLQVLRARRPIESVVLDQRTPESVRETLFEVRDAREFASSELHLPENSSYRTYADIGRPYVVWNVVATSEFSVEPKRWCFPVAGCVAYRGYFKEKRAQAFAAALAKQGLDVTVGGVPAYSTLGKFADPVLSSMIAYGNSQLVGTMFHELAHQLLYVKNDSEFNESFAMTVEEAGLQRWLKLRGRPQDVLRYRRSRDREQQFIGLFSAARGKLIRLYASRVPAEQMRQQKRQILAQLADDLRTREKSLGVRSSLYESWLAQGLNNAQLASMATYYDCIPGFQRLLAEQGEDLTRFYAAAREIAKLRRSQRHAKLCLQPGDISAAAPE